MTIIVNYKTCTKCGMVKPVDEFHRKLSSPDGRQPWCKKCQLDASRTNRTNKNQCPRVTVKPGALAGLNKRGSTDANNPLAEYTPRELMLELKRRGYEGDLTYTAKISLSNL